MIIYVLCVIILFLSVALITTLLSYIKLKKCYEHRPKIKIDYFNVEKLNAKLTLSREEYEEILKYPYGGIDGEGILHCRIGAIVNKTDDDLADLVREVERWWEENVENAG